MKKNLLNLKKIIGKNRILWFDFNNNKILIDSSKTKSKKRILKKFKKKSINLIRLEISFHKGTGNFQGGPIKINFRTFHIYKKLYRKHIAGLNGPIWIDNHWLKLNNINKKSLFNRLIKKIIKTVLKKKPIKIPGINTLTVII